VRSHLIIIDTVGFQLPPQMPFIYDDNVIQTLSAYGPDNSLDIRILPRRARGRNPKPPALAGGCSLGQSRNITTPAHSQDDVMLTGFLSVQQQSL
jgi:hypothetical protein